MADASRFPLGSKLTLDSLSIDPYPHYRLLLDREPATWVPKVNLWYVTRRDDVVAVLDNMDAFTVQAALAQLEGEIGLRVLFERLPHLHLKSTHPSAPRGHEFRSVPELMVEW